MAARTRYTDETVLAAIDVGTNAVRLELARPIGDGAFETLHQERDPVRPGEGVFKTGSIPREVADRLLSTLRRYGALCRRYKAKVRAVATSAVREARNRDEIVRRAREEAGINLEVVSGTEEARLICLGVLQGKPPGARSLIIDIGGGSTEVADAVGEKPAHLWSVSVGAVRLTEVFSSTGKLSKKQLRLMREYALEAFAEALPRRIASAPRSALGSAGTIRTVVGYAAAPGTAHATTHQLTRTVDELADMSPDERRQKFDSKRAEIIVAGAIVLEAVARHLGLRSVTAVDRGLRHGLLLDLLRRTRAGPEDHSLADAALEIGRRFHLEAHHGAQVARIALALFDDLAAMHRLPAAARPLLEVAALLHDVGNAVNYQRHHKHSYYLIQNADLPGLTDRERELVALTARYHRRGAPERDKEDLEALTAPEFQMVRKLSTLLRVADALDRSHHQPVRKMRAAVSGSVVHISLGAKGPLDLELWDAEHETALFRRVFGKRLEISVSRR